MLETLLPVNSRSLLLEAGSKFPFQEEGLAETMARHLLCLSALAKEVRTNLSRVYSLAASEQVQESSFGSLQMTLLPRGSIRYVHSQTVKKRLA